MQRRFAILLVSAVAFLFITGSFLFGHKLPEKYQSVFQRPPTHNAQETRPSIRFTVGGPALPPPAPSIASPAPAPSPAPQQQQQQQQHDPAALHITVTETGGSHDEVVAALVHSFGAQSHAVIDLYQLLPRYRIADIMAGFTLASPVPRPKSPQQFIDSSAAQRTTQILVAATCELDLIKFRTQMAQLLAARKTYLFCVVHHADRWTGNLEAEIRPWAQAGMMTFLTLSPHTKKYLQSESMGKWSASTPRPPVHPFVPLFPVPLPELASGSAADKEELLFGLQGDYDPSRRNYNEIFSQLVSFLGSSGSAKTRNITMHLLGHGQRPAVPAELAHNVVFDERLDYFQFYALISRAFALLPAFASPTYLDRKASSSVPAALIAGVPLVASKAVLNAYPYIDQEVVWLQGDSETNVDVVGRILNLDPRERRIKKELVRKRCAKIIEENTKTVGEWIDAALKRVKRE